MPPPAYRGTDLDFDGTLWLYPTLAALFEGNESALREHPPGNYRVLDFGRHASGHHDGGSDGYYYWVGRESGPSGWCWQHAIGFFMVPDDGKNEGDFDLSGPTGVKVRSRFQVGEEIEIPQSFLGWSALWLAQNPDKSFERICDCGTYSIQDVGTFESDGEMCLGEEDVDLSRVDDIEDIMEMPFYLLKSVANGEQFWTYEFLLSRAMAGQPAAEVLRELSELSE